MGVIVVVVGLCVFCCVVVCMCVWSSSGMVALAHRGHEVAQVRSIAQKFAAR